MPMEFLLPIIKVIGGFTLLIIGGDLLIRAAVSLAVRLKVSPAVIGLTVVAAGTSLPELVTSLLAAGQGNNEIAIANVIGSNIFNILAIIGITSIILPNKVTKEAMKLEWPFLMLSTIIFFLLGMKGSYGRFDGIFFTISIFCFMSFSVWRSRKLTKKQLEESSDEEIVQSNSLILDLVLVLAGFVLLGVGADIALDGAVKIGVLFGISQRVIGLTIVAAGTGLPEMVTSVIAVYKGRNDIAVANVLGSCMFNTLMIIGCTSIIFPLTISEQIINFDMWILLASCFILFPFMLDKLISRKEGAFLLVAYLLYLYSLI